MNMRQAPGKTPPLSTRYPDESIYQALSRLGLTSDATRRLIATDTRDVKNINVYKDVVSGVVFIDGHYVGSDTYKSGEYRKNSVADPTATLQAGFEDHVDTTRRLESYKQFVTGKVICDFGCGAGSFLNASRPLASRVCGIELQLDYLSVLRSSGIPCVNTLDQMEGDCDTAFLFHSFEHLPNPSSVLRDLHAVLKKNGAGRIVIEVPHARDFLIEGLSCPEFLEFSLWSQHLILHTRESLKSFLEDAGFKSVVVEGVQRFGIANHLHWLRHQRPGGHKSNLSVLETPSLKQAYADALSRLDANDSLVAIAST